MTREEHWKIVDAVIDAHKDNEMGGKYAKAFNHGVQSAFNRVCKALDDIKKQQQPNRCDSCTHSEEQDGSNCYECVKGMADNFEAQPKTGYISIDVNKLAKEVAEKVLDEITYEGKTIREWAEILVKQQPCEDCISRDSLNDAISELTYWHYEDGRLVVGGDGRSNTVYKVDDVTRLVHVLPSVTPQRPEGRWIEVLENRNEFGSTWHYECSECRAKSYKGFEPLERYCPNCGAKMEVEE